MAHSMFLQQEQAHSKPKLLLQQQQAVTLGVLMRLIGRQVEVPQAQLLVVLTLLLVAGLIIVLVVKLGLLLVVIVM